MKDFTIIICTYNSEKRINQIINAILAQNRYSDLVYELIVVDNNSSDATKFNVCSYGSIVKYVYEGRQGLSFARLAGVKLTTTKWIIFIDDDNILKQNWLVEAYSFINCRPNIGAFNGAVIPLVEFNINNEEDARLKASYLGLACTHLTEQSICVIGGFIPFGAGLVIRTECLKELASIGWLNSTGRNGDSLVSGEDTEMVLHVKKSGYDLGICEKMVMYHQIPQFRLAEDYLIKLYVSFVPFSFQLCKQKYKFLYPIAFLKRYLISVVKVIICKVFHKNYSTYFASRLSLAMSMKSLQMVFLGSKK